MDLKKCKAKYWLQLQIDDVDLTDSHICAGSNTWLLQQHEEACKVCFLKILSMSLRVSCFTFREILEVLWFVNHPPAITQW